MEAISYRAQDHSGDRAQPGQQFRPGVGVKVGSAFRAELSEGAVGSLITPQPTFTGMETEAFFLCGTVFHSYLSYSFVTLCRDGDVAH